ncbi:MAG: dihydropteroate synthase [Oligoflexia bacterium]|nr:dihydropteroate synthase [Oligoflexia bacterium]
MSGIYPIRLSKQSDAVRILKRIGVEDAATGILLPKAFGENILLKNIKSSWANIIKQEMIACGGDAAVNRNSYSCRVDSTDVLLMGSMSALERFSVKLKRQPYCFGDLALKIESLLANRGARIYIGDMLLELPRDFVVMGILNVTDNSFSDGGKYLDYDSAMKKAGELVRDGSTVIDVGGESTRPGSRGISAAEETDRVIPVIEGIKKNFEVPVSVDSCKPEVLMEAIKAGARMANDISNGSAIAQVADIMVEYKTTALAMMNRNPDGVSGVTPDSDIEDEPVAVFLDFITGTGKMLEDSGIARERIIYDPGIGFGFSVNDTGRLLKNIYSVTAQGIPVCVGLSRKSYLGKITGLSVERRDPLTNAASLFLMEQGARIFRTHDPEGLNNVISLYKAVNGV